MNGSLRNESLRNGTSRLARLAPACLCLLGVLGAALRAQDADRAGDADITRPPRWAVMTGTDPDAARVPSAPKPTTIGKLGALPRPDALPLRGADNPAFRQRRVAPAETTLWQVDATLVSVQANGDGDYRLVLRGASGVTLVCELPDPARMERRSRFAAGMRSARARLAPHLRPGAPAGGRIRVTGLGYFGHVRPGQPGTANGFQLHPVTGVTFL